MPSSPELRDERHRESAGPVVLGDERQELGLDPVADRVAHHPLLVGEEGLDAVVVHSAELLHVLRPLGGPGGPPVSARLSRRSAA